MKTELETNGANLKSTEVNNDDVQYVSTVHP